jgi:hypothetical protein
MTEHDNAPAGTGASSEDSGEQSNSDSTTSSRSTRARRWTEEGAPRAIDVTTLSNRPPRAQIIKGLWPVKSVLGIAGEEGDGKTLLAEQILRQLMRGERPLGFFEGGEAVPQTVLFVDTEMEEDDAAERNAEMEVRGLRVVPGQLHWLSAGRLALDDPVDIAFVASEATRVGADLLWIDSGINAVSEAEEGVAVKSLFNNLSRLMREQELLGIGLTLHTRKRAQGVKDRRFDDLFGSREWKGRLNTLLYIEANRVTSWKNRGGRLATLWPSHSGKRPHAILDRPGLVDEMAVPFIVTLSEDGGEAVTAEVADKIREILDAEPDTHTKTSLVQAVGARKTNALEIISQLQTDGAVVPNQARAKLRLAKPESEQGAASSLNAHVHVGESRPEPESSRDGSL